VATHRIRANAVAGDIRSGKTDIELMVKYQLSRKALGKLFEKLLESRLIAHDELYKVSSLYKEKVDKTMTRLHARADLKVKIPIYDISSSKIGLVRDISERGLRVAGIEAEVGEVKTFQLSIDSFIQADPLLVLAECRWVEMKGKNKKYPVAGFELKDLSEADEKALRTFVDFLIVSKSGEWQALK
jgi:hypothetical protein